ncbi:uncharacterized protein CMU_036040 [Cryptosporidium muris RN66]|uniref:SNF7 family protein n=1 Tax=Cryptosporidium muris (strain RN66) TaxID=441375 RepID=B6AGU0_CRYMR|nr:uncharacterized protein CMU_036040 [Cryptosporidium muris RN66]EEA07431.1 hypothetical protein, conserved [Cryptosporidium muris RN66]|eukprot:XP_002141780.1 hypothetical protein [Cryptosporidium muris RN66]
MGAKLTIEDSIFDIKLKVRELQRLSRNRNDLSKSERNKAKFAMLSGDTEIAKIHAENAIRMQKERTDYLLMSSKLDEICSRLEKVSRTETISKKVLDAVSTLQKDLSDNRVIIGTSIEKIQQISYLLDEIDTKQSRATANSSATKESKENIQDDIESLLQQLASEHSMEIERTLLFDTLSLKEGTSENVSKWEN